MVKKLDKKLSLNEMIDKMDAAKKKNPLDLSSDQDLSIGLMNLISLEEHFFFSGGKTGKTGFYDLIDVVRQMRTELMKKIVRADSVEDGEVWCISKHLLAASMRLKEVGDKAIKEGKKQDAVDLYSKAYDLYSLFWGINMDLIDLTGVQKIDAQLPHGLDIWVGDIQTKQKDESKKKKEEIKAASATSRSAKSDDKSLTKRMGTWVKNAVNCCIE